MQELMLIMQIRVRNLDPCKSHGYIVKLGFIGGMYRILTEFKVFMYWKDPPRANRDAKPLCGEALQFVRAGLSST